MNAWFRCASALTIGLQVPAAYFVVPAVWFVTELCHWTKKPTVTQSELINVALLAGFTLAYFSAAILFGFLDWASSIGWMIIIPVMYAIGLLVGKVSRPRRNDSPTVLLTLSFILGGACFVFLTVSFSYSLEDIFSDEYLKVVPSIWSGGPINRPGLGALASLGMCLLGMLLFWRNIAAMKGGYVLVALLVCAIGVGSYSNLVLANRTPWLAMAFAFLITWLLWVRIAPVRRLLQTGLSLFLASLLIAPFWTDVVEVAESLYVITRFLDEGIDTAGRYDSWIAMASSLFDQTEGGRIADMGGIAMYTTCGSMSHGTPA